MKVCRSPNLTTARRSLCFATALSCSAEDRDHIVAVITTDLERRLRDVELREVALGEREVALELREESRRASAAAEQILSLIEYSFSCSL